ncbi:XapX domain-containing protein [Methyloversatilis sp.]|uniref:XapX domain-containing protein n=1 Tax=Methyloversatilis sp. TaxID=2569862 RepID=UPI003D2B37D4
MKLYILSLAAGLLVGVIYALLGVRSPAPPVVALIGLLGILAGEQIPPLVRHLSQREPGSQSGQQHPVLQHMSGKLPESAPNMHSDPASARTSSEDPHG